MLGSLIATAAGALTGGLKDAIAEKITAQARKALHLNPEATRTTIDSELAKNPEVYAQLVLSANKLAAEREETLRTEIIQTGETTRAAYSTDDRFVRRMRPTAGYAAITLCALVVITELVIVWAQLSGFDVHPDVTILKDAQGVIGMMFGFLGIYGISRGAEKVWGKTK